MSKTNTVPLALPGDLHKEIKRGAKETGLSQADVMRHSLRLGLPIFVGNFPKPGNLAPGKEPATQVFDPTPSARAEGIERGSQKSEPKEKMG